jgi:RimJ/RimL family protein N-acetyltransferase
MVRTPFASLLFSLNADPLTRVLERGKFPTVTPHFLRMGPTIETARLRLRPRTLSDLDAILAMDLDPEVFRYLVSEAPDASQRREETRSRIAAGWPKQGGHWVIEWKKRSGLLGACYLVPMSDGNLVGLGYRLAKSAWGQGVATEAALAVLNHGFKRFGYETIVAVHHPENLASRRVIEKLGFKSTGVIPYSGSEVPCYRLARNDFLAAKQIAQGQFRRQ